MAHASGFGFATWMAFAASVPLVACSVDDRMLRRSSAETSPLGSGADPSGGFGNGGDLADAAADSGDFRSSGGRGEGGHGATGGRGTTGGQGGAGGGLPQGAGGTNVGGDGTGTGGTSSDGGAPGAGGVVGCLSEIAAEGCDKTLIANPTFATNAAGWTAETEVTETWSSKDATDMTGSGSLSVKSTIYIDTTGTGSAGSTQCIAIAADTTYILAANAFIASGQGAGSAAVAAGIYDGPACAGRPSWNALSTLTGTVDKWSTTIGSIHSTPSAQSMLVHLVAVKPYRVKSFEVLFDDVRVYAAP